MIRTLLLIVAALAGGCSEPDAGPELPPPPTLASPEAEPARASLLEHLERLADAFDQEDFAAQADLTHPRLIAEVGGRSVYEIKLRELAKTFREDRITLDRIEVTSVSDVYVNGDALFAICEHEGTMNYPGFVRYRVPSFLIAESRDGGASWVFVDGKGLASRPELIPVILEDFPPGLALPELRDPFKL